MSPSSRSSLVEYVRSALSERADPFRYCEMQAHEKDFLIRKAMGWALGDHARTELEAVARSANEHRAEPSGLGHHEATRHTEETAR